MRSAATASPLRVRSATWPLPCRDREGLFPFLKNPRANRQRLTLEAAAEVLKITPSGWQEYHRAALFTCRAISRAAKDDQLTDAQRQAAIAAYGTQALQLLHQAVQHGYTDAAALKQEPAFAPLRDRPDFQKLLSKFEGKTK